MYAEYTLYGADVPVTGMLSDAYNVERAMDDTAGHEDEEGAREVPTTAETTKMIPLHRNKVDVAVATN